MLEAKELCGIFARIKNCFNVSEDAEISVECNPATADFDYFKKIRFAGFNRLSIGVQSMDDGELRLLGRLHKACDAENTICMARKAGFDNVSVDVMYGIPDQTVESLKKTLGRLCTMAPEHISLYGLKIEDGTHFARHRNELKLPDEDEEYEMYMSSVSLLAAEGYEKYEISNFAKNGRYSRHNLKYWQREDYLGLGLAAHSCVEDRRFANTCDIEKYLLGDRLGSDEIISTHDVLCEKIMLGMRLGCGIDFSLLGDCAAVYKDGLERFIPSGHVEARGNSLSFTDKGMYISNYILSEILDFEE